MKKWIALLLVMIMMVPACSLAVDAADLEYVKTLMPSVKQLCEPGTVTLKIMAVVNSACDTWKDQTVMKAYEELTGVHVEWVEIDGVDINQNIRLTVMGMADDPNAVDMICVGSPGNDLLQDYGENGTLLALNDLIDEYAPNAKAIIEKVPGVEQAITAPDGNIYCMFKVWENPNETIPNKQFVFLPWVEKYTEATGKGQPDTLEEYVDMLRYFRDNDMNGNGDATDEIPLLGNNQTRSEGGSASGYIISAFELWNPGNFLHITDGSFVFEANTDAYRDALKFMRDMNAEGLYPEDDFTLSLGDYRNTTNATKPEEIRVGVGAAPYYMRVITQSIYTRAYEDWEAMKPLKNAYDENVRESVQTRQSMITPMVLINSKCKNPEIAMQWLDYWYTEEGTHLNTLYGIYGRDWEWDDEIPGLNGKTPSVKSIQTLENSGNVDCPSHTGLPNYMSEEMFLQTAASKAGRTYPDYLAHCVYAPYAVWTGLPTAVWCDDLDLATEYQELSTQINDCVVTSLAAFVLGKDGFDPYNDTDWQNYLDKLNALGLERYLEILPEYYGI